MRSSGRLAVESNNEAIVMLLCGQPLHEPVGGHGPFVMSTAEEIDAAIADFKQSRFARIPA